jgi:hypothetical protein
MSGFIEIEKLMQVRAECMARTLCLRGQGSCHNQVPFGFVKISIDSTGYRLYTFPREDRPTLLAGFFPVKPRRAYACLSAGPLPEDTKSTAMIFNGRNPDSFETFAAPVRSSSPDCVIPAWSAGIQANMDVSASILANLDAGYPCRHDEDLRFHVL